MKLALTLIILGGILLAEGGARITFAAATGNAGMIIGGLATGIGLGGYLLFRGIRRYAMVKQGSVAPRKVEGHTGGEPRDGPA